MNRKHWSTKTRLAIRERFEAECFWCKCALGVRGFELDHAIPLAIGGEDVEENLRPLCLPCHRLKTRGDVGEIAKAKRREARFIGCKAPSRKPLPGGRHSREKIKMDGSVVDRWTGEILRSPR